MSKHRATDRTEARSYTEATCTGMGSFPDPGHSFCPRHHADAYAEMFARHATDSLSPADRAQAFHNFGVTR
jgi:hypothetical protein